MSGTTTKQIIAVLSRAFKFRSDLRDYAFDPQSDTTIWYSARNYRSEVFWGVLSLAEIGDGRTCRQILDFLLGSEDPARYRFCASEDLRRFRDRWLDSTPEAIIAWGEKGFLDACNGKPKHSVKIRRSKSPWRSPMKNELPGAAAG